MPEGLGYKKKTLARAGLKMKIRALSKRLKKKGMKKKMKTMM